MSATISKRLNISPRNWEEDREHENGRYNCRCNACGEIFLGHKRRVTCRLCAGPTVKTLPLEVFTSIMGGRRLPYGWSYYTHLFIWSGEHKAYWRKDGKGYSEDRAGAGVYTYGEAQDNTFHCGPEKQIAFEMCEAPVVKKIDDQALLADARTIMRRVIDSTPSGHTLCDLAIQWVNDYDEAKK